MQLDLSLVSLVEKDRSSPPLVDMIINLVLISNGSPAVFSSLSRPSPTACRR